MAILALNAAGTVFPVCPYGAGNQIYLVPVLHLMAEV